MYVLPTPLINWATLTASVISSFVARGKPKLKAVAATMGKLAEIIYHCLNTGEFYSYQGKYRSLGKVGPDSQVVTLKEM